MRSTEDDVWEQHGIVVDATYWPVLVEHLPIVFPSHDAAIDAWIAHVDRLLEARAEPFVMIVDGLAVKRGPDAHARRRMAEWLSESRAYRAHCLGNVNIIASPIVRGALSAINWLAAPRPPRPVVGSWPEALVEARVLLHDAGLAGPRDLEGLLAKTA